jgi:hypothetical protein
VGNLFARLFRVSPFRGVGILLPGTVERFTIDLPTVLGKQFPHRPGQVLLA